MPAGKGKRDATRHGATPSRVIIDSCVWHGAFVRHVLRHLALEGLFEPRWTALIESEWIQSVHRARPQISADRLVEVRDRFRAEFPDGLLPVRLPRRKLPPLPDPNDAHVVEAALECEADAICTLDDRGFPGPIMLSLGIEIVSPDELVSRLIAREPARGHRALHTHRIALRSPPMSAEEYQIAFRRAGMHRSADDLAERRDTPRVKTRPRRK